MPGIIWLASYPKSGNTWLRAFLANLMHGGDAPLPLNQVPKFSHGDNNLAHYHDLVGYDPSELPPERIAALRPKVHRTFASLRREEVFVKTHNAVLKIHGTPLITPDATAGAIYVVRNPLDVAVSFAHHYATTPEKAVAGLCNEQFMLLPSDNHLTQYLGSWSGHLRSWTSAPGLTLHVMRYEDMTARPLEAFAAVSRFLGFPEDPVRLERAVRFSSFDELSSQEETGGFVEARADAGRFFRSGQVGVWRDVLSEADIARLIEVNGPAMRDHGYLDAEGRPVDGL